MMPLQEYPWSKKYGWLVDQFGMTWQLMMGSIAEIGQKITTSFLFVGEQYGKAQEAIQHYKTIFNHSAVHFLDIYKAGEMQPEGNLKFGSFSLNGEQFAAMDGLGNHEFKFSEGVSLVVECDNQEEINHYWYKLIADGGAEVQCGWLVDKFGVSWQIIPKMLGSLMLNPEKGGRAMQALLKMKKLDIAILQNA
jgi:predicted 3-demethylubiquinone-9 3-methyltransferase (glyoxalase superfamily)